MLQKRSQWLSIFLAFVLLATSNGLALGAASHDHKAAHPASSSPMATEPEQAHHAHQAASTSAHAQHHDTANSDSAEECVCDEVCCVSYASFDTSNSHTVAVLHDSNSPIDAGYYQSIALDLHIPPPKV
jgi:hypothetical protein